jgi:hypothetical protein
VQIRENSWLKNVGNDSESSGSKLFERACCKETMVNLNSFAKPAGRTVWPGAAARLSARRVVLAPAL